MTVLHAVVLVSVGARLIVAHARRCDDAAVDLTAETSPLTSSTAGQADNFESDCSGTSSAAPDRIYFADVPPGSMFWARQTYDEFSAVQETRRGGDCPGATVIACTRTSNWFARHVWINDRNATERVFFIIDGWSATESGNFTIEWSLRKYAPQGTTHVSVSRSALTICAHADAVWGTLSDGRLRDDSRELPSGYAVIDGLRAAIIASGASIRSAYDGALDAAYFDSVDVFVVTQLADAPGGNITTAEVDAMRNFAHNGGVVILGVDNSDAEPTWLSAFGFSGGVRQTCCLSTDEVDASAHTLVSNVSRLFSIVPMTFEAPDGAQVLATWTNSSGTAAAVVEGIGGGSGAVLVVDDDFLLDAFLQFDDNAFFIDNLVPWANAIGKSHLSTCVTLLKGWYM